MAAKIVKACGQREFRINARSKLLMVDSAANGAIFCEEKLLVTEKRHNNNNNENQLVCKRNGKN